MVKHTHDFQLVRPNGTIRKCECGAWRHSEHNTNPVVIEHSVHSDEDCAPMCASRVPFGECTCGRADREADREGK